MKKHLAIFSRPAVKEILEGKRVVETRLSKRKLPPFLEISVGDLVYIKPSGEEIKGQFLVKKVIFLEGLTEEDEQLINKLSGQKIKLDKNFKFATLIFIGNIEQFLTPPVKIPKKDKRAWVVLP